MRITEALRGNWNFKGWKGLLPRMDFLMGGVAGLLTGLSLIYLGPFPTIAMVAGIAYLVILIRAPEIPILILLAYTSGLLPSQYNPYFGLFVGRFQASDLILLSLLALTITRVFAEPSFRIRKSPVNLPLLLFCLSVCIGMGTAVIHHGVNFSHTTYEARILLYYALFFVVENLVRNRTQLKRLIWGVFVIGFCTALLIVLQTISFISFFQTDSSSSSQLLQRAFHPGFNSILMTILAFVCLLGEKSRFSKEVWIWFALLILGSSILLSLGRNIILSISITLLVLLLIMEKHRRIRLIKSLLILVLASLCAFNLLRILAPSAEILDYPQALADRFVHLFTTDPLSSKETLLWRIQETQYAWEKIIESPFLGIGLKTEYRPEFYEGDSLTSYIHNGYLWLWLKLGLPGLISFLWMLLAFLLHALRYWKNISDQFIGLSSLGFVMAIFAIVFSNFVAPGFVSHFNLAFFAAGMGVFEVSLALEKKPDEI